MSVFILLNGSTFSNYKTSIQNIIPIASPGLSHQLLTMNGGERKYMTENHPNLYKVSTLPTCLGLLIFPVSWIILTICDRLILDHEQLENETHFYVICFFSLNLIFTLGISTKICFFFIYIKGFRLIFKFSNFYSTHYLPESKIWTSATQCWYGYVSISSVVTFYGLKFQRK